MSRRKEARQITFLSRTDAKKFIDKIGLAFLSADGVFFVFEYADCKIRLLSEMDMVFMIVQEKGKNHATLRLLKGDYEKINVL